MAARSTTPPASKIDTYYRLGEITVFDSGTDFFHLSNHSSNESAIGTALHFVDEFVKTV